MNSRELLLNRLQDEIEELEILNKVYRGTLESEKAEHSKLLASEEKDKVKLEEKRKVIKIIKRNLKARREKIDYLKSREKLLKKSIKQGGDSAWDIMNRKGYKPKEFWQDSKYI